jgi:hypothetical protein
MNRHFTNAGIFADAINGLALDGGWEYVFVSHGKDSKSHPID